MGCVVLVFAALGCGAAEEGEDLGQSQLAQLQDDRVLRINTGGNCIENQSGSWKSVNCAQPYPNGKKWDFIGDTTSGFRLQTNSGSCITAPLGAWSGITLLVTTLCSPDSYSRWKVKPGSGSLGENTFQLYNLAYPSMCISEDPAGGAYMRLATCANTWPAIEKQRLLLDNF